MRQFDSTFSKQSVIMCTM